MACTAAAGTQLVTPFTKRRRKTNKPGENNLDIHLEHKERVKMNEIISAYFSKIFAMWPIVNAKEYTVMQ